MPNACLISAVSPDSIEELYRKGKQHLEEKEFDQALACFNHIIKIQPNHLDALASAALALLLSGRPQLALKTYRLALHLAPHNAVFLNGIATCFMVQGDFDKASSHFEKALKINANASENLYNLSLINDYSLNCRVALELQRLYRTSECTGLHRVAVCFALGKIFESNAEPLRAFGYYEEANRLHFAQLKYQEEIYLSLFSRLQTFFNDNLFSRIKNVGSSDHAYPVATHSH
jgi:tetratricopeptide (TPR) repeat protein